MQGFKNVIGGGGSGLQGFKQNVIGNFIGGGGGLYGALSWVVVLRTYFTVIDVFY